jgi:hypothetical protein
LTVLTQLEDRDDLIYMARNNISVKENDNKKCHDNSHPFKYENGVCNISKCKGQIPQNGWFHFKVKLFWATQNF